MTSVSVSKLNNSNFQNDHENMNFWARWPKVTSLSCSGCFKLLYTTYVKLSSSKFLSNWIFWDFQINLYHFRNSYLQAFEEFFIASWIWSLGDGPQMWEEIIQTDGLFGQLRLWHSVDFVTAQKVEDILIGWVVTETSGQVGAFSPGDQTLTTGAIEELESVVES